MRDRIFREAEAEYKAGVMYDTFGHLDAKVGEKHEGWFVGKVTRMMVFE